MSSDTRRGSNESRDREGRSRGRDDDRDDDRGRDRGRGRDRDDDRGGRSGGRGRYEYKARDAADVKHRSESGPNDFDKYLVDSIKVFKPQKDNSIRILPPTWPGAKHYGYDLFVHYGVGADRQTYLCLNKMKGEKCPICEERQRLADDGDEDGAKELEPKKRVLVYMIDRDKEKEGLQAWPMPWTVDRDICAISVDRRTGGAVPIDHPEEGYDIMFEKKGEKARTEYLGIRLDRRESELGDMKWLDEAMDNPLPDQLVFYEYDHIAKAFGGGGKHRDSRRDDDRGDDRGRDRGRDRDEDRGSRGRDRDDDRGSRGRSKEPEYTWESVHKLEGRALDDLISAERLKLDPGEFKSDEELADAICEELGLEEEQRGRGRDRDDDRGGRDRDRDDDPREKLREMRNRRSESEEGEGRRRTSRD